MPEIARDIVIDYTREKLLVDGAEFPWIITEDGPNPSAVPGESLRMVTVTLLADHVEIVGRPMLSAEAAAGRDKQGDIRTYAGTGALIARAADTRADIQGRRDIAKVPRFVAMFDSALALLDDEPLTTQENAHA